MAGGPRVGHAVGWAASAGCVLAAQLSWAGREEASSPLGEPAPPTLATASAAPGPTPPGAIAFEAMLGPFGSVEVYCARLASERPARHCLPAPNDWDTRERRGARGPFLSARLLTTTGTLGPHQVQVCRVAMQTPSGWYVSASEGPCQGQTRGAKVGTRLSRFRWADEVGPGVLLATASHDDEVSTEQQRWWGGIQVGFADSRTSMMLCGMGNDGVPRCSPPLVDSCTTLDSGDGMIRITGGKLVVDGDRAARARCAGVLPPAGSHELPFRGAAPGPRAWVPVEDSRGTAGDAAGITTIPAYGPFASMQQYCADLPDFDVWADPPSDEDNPLKPRRRPEACAAGGGWSGLLGGSGPLDRIQLVRIRNDMAGATIHHCRIAMRTGAGWFFTTDYSTCEGVLGPSSTAETRARTLRWVGPVGSPAALVEATTTISHESYERPEEEPDVFGVSGSGSASRDRQPRTFVGPRQRNVRLCGLGPSGVPSCTPWIQAGCVRAGGSATHDVAWNGAMLELKENAPLSEAEQSECVVEKMVQKVTLR